MKSKSHHSTRVNPRVNVDLTQIVRAFLAQNPSPFDFDEVIQLYSNKQYKLAKEAFSVILSSSLCIGRDEYSTTAQVGALLFKAELSSSSDIKVLESEAVANFIATEQRLSHVNWKIGMDKSLPGCPEHIANLIAKARWLIAGVLPKMSTAMPHILRHSRPGSGVTLDTVDRARSAYCYKYSEQSLGWYESGLDFHLPLLAQSKLHQNAMKQERGNLHPTVHSSNRVTFVPKNVTSLRSIAIEPNGQMMIQLGTHHFLAKVLSKLGNDIRFQERNQILARQGSVSGSHATIDLASASDSISLALVYQLLPSDWFEFLYKNRAKWIELPDETKIYSMKFSSMGNGFTFALETLIFFSLARAVCGSGLISVYGDDIIVPTQDSAKLIELLEYLGFLVNTEKTFLSGPFRESCGSDWYQGELVTPKYWRASDRPTVVECYEFYNSCASIAPRFNWGGVRKYIMECLKEGGARVLFGPTYMPENSCIHAPDSYLTGAIKRRWDKHLQCYRYRVIAFRPSKRRACEEKPYTALAMLRHGNVVSYLPLRRLGKYRVVWTA